MSDVSAGDPVSWRRFGERPVYESPEVSLSQVDVELPSRERVLLPLVRLPWSVAVALLDDQERVLLVWRYRFARERWGWELPGGQVDSGEGLAAAAARELEELTGYRAGSLVHLITYQPVAEIVDAERIVLIGREPVAVASPVGLDAGERAEWVSLTSVPGLIADGFIWNGTALLALLLLLAQGRP